MKTNKHRGLLWHLRERFAKVALVLHADKTRLIESGDLRPTEVMCRYHLEMFPLRNILSLTALFLAWSCSTLAQIPRATDHIIFVMTDGLRWQEVFTGADESLMNKESGGVAEPEALKKLYWRDLAQARREALMPFFWSVIAKQGQVYGNRDLGSDAYVTNGLNFSYPGYSETLCGFADPRVDSNEKVPNPNVTVLEWLNHMPKYKNKVAAFGAWDVFPSIFNANRAGFLVNAGYDPLTTVALSPRIELLNELKAETPRVWPDESFDDLTFHTAVEYLKTAKPKILYISLGETDDWAHLGNYAEYLTAAHRVDAYLKAIWDLAQSLPEYRGKTTLIFSPDHGRGTGLVDWKSHGQKVPEAKYIWMGFLGPDTPPLGERAHVPPVTQNQIAATLAALIGENYALQTNKAGKAIPDVLPK